MATIPRIDQSQVQTNALPTPQMRPSSTGAALEDVSRDVSGVANDMFQHAMEQKRNADSSAVMEAQVSLNKATMDLQTQALQRQGHDALDNKGMYETFDKLYADHAGKMKNDTQRRIFAAQTANDRNQFQLSLERHAAEQGRILNVNNASALVETDMQKLSTLYRDPQAFDQQLKVAQAHTLDLLHMHGIADSDPQAAEKLAEIKSKAYVDRIKQMMVENPSEAQHLYEVHQDEIEPHERESLKHSVAAMSEQRTGIDAAEALTPEIMKGGKTYSELRTQLYEQLKDKPAAFKIAEQQLRGNYQAAKEDRAERVADLGAKVETALTSAIANGRTMTPKQLAAIPEYQALLKEGSKESIAEASRFMHQSQLQVKEAEREKHELDRERKADQREARAERREREREAKLSQAEWTAAHDDPDILLSAKESDIRKLAPKIGYNNVNQLLKKRREYLKDDVKLQNAKIDRDSLVTEMTAAGMTYQINPSKAKTDDFQKTAKFKARVAELSRYEQEKTGKPITPERQKEIIREQLLKVHVRAKGLLGMGEDEKMQFETEYPENFVVPGASPADTQTVVAAYRRRGVTPTFDMVQRGVEALKRK